MLKKLLSRIIHIAKWIPVLWKDNDWDYEYLLRIIKFKLECMREYHRNYGHTKDHNKIADEIHKCVLVLNRIIEDDYSVYASHYKKWGEPVLETANGHLDIVHENCVTEKDKEQERKEFLECAHREYNMKVQDLKYFSKLFSKHLFKWWD